MSKYIELEGQQFGMLRADEFIGGEYGEWKCTCLICNREYITRGKYLRNGTKTACKECSKKHNVKPTQIIEYNAHKPKYDMTDMIIGSVHVIRFIPGGSWECKCSCGRHIVVKGFNLRKALDENKDYKCEICSRMDKLDDISGKQFGNWLVLEYAGNGYYKCQCQCDNKTIKNIYGKSLKNGTSTSCGCLTGKKIVESRYNKYGDLTVNIKENRTDEQILASSDSEQLKAFIIRKFDTKPTVLELSRALGIGTCMTARKLNKFDARELVDYSGSRSSVEKELGEYIGSIYKGSMILNCRNVIPPLELDIYIPEKKIAIEFNGNFWHSDIYKDKYYHQQKTIECAKRGIQLVHIFEYEWLDADKQRKLKELLSNLLVDSDMIYARKTEVKLVSKEDAESFINRYHLQGYTNSSINIGLYYNNELISILTLGKPRFNHDYEYEIIRMCTKSGVKIVGGAEKMFSYFLHNYKASSVLTYSDISKFTGNIYTKLGFKVDRISEPNYVWIEPYKNIVLSRYKTQKHKLLQSIPDIDINKSETEIMSDLGYIRVYDCGNIVMTYKK